jgi:hypothetical protein
MSQDEKAAEELAIYFIVVIAKYLILNVFSYLPRKCYKIIKNELESFNRYFLTHIFTTSVCHSLAIA